MNALITKFNTDEAGKMAGVKRATVIRWINEGLLKATNVGDGTQRPRWQIEQEDLEEAIERMKNARKTRKPKKKVDKPDAYIKELLEENRRLRKEIDTLKSKNNKMIGDILGILADNEIN